MRISIGLIPSVVISRQNVVENLKGIVSIKKTGFGFKHGMIVFQFIITIALIVSVIALYRQNSFLIHSDYGFNKEHIYCLRMNTELWEKTGALEEEISRHPFVKDIAYGFDYLGKWANGHGGIELVSGNQKYMVRYNYFPVYGEFVELFGLNIIEGRDFSQSISDNEVLVNRSFIEKYKIKNPINAQINSHVNFKIIGVIEDFNYKSKHFPIEPVVFRHSEYGKNIMYIKFKTTNIVQHKDVIDDLKNTWKKVTDIYPFEGKFLDDHYNSIYQEESKFMQILALFSALAILLACLGLFGISLNTVEMRTKEIGVRKVNGASVLTILSLLNRSFISIIIIAFLTACPIAYYLISRWFENFAYKINLSWWIFALAGGITVLIAVITVSWQSWRAANRNPVEALRYE